MTPNMQTCLMPPPTPFPLLFLCFPCPRPRTLLPRHQPPPIVPSPHAPRYTCIPLQVVHSLKAGVVEPAMSKVKSLRLACEAAITILRIDDFIKIDKPQQGGGR